ncbi:MAG: BlaI/MecI/CopY family transcriptional regulator [Conexivisphaerales archaeon]
MLAIVLFYKKHTKGITKHRLREIIKEEIKELIKAINLPLPSKSSVYVCCQKLEEKKLVEVSHEGRRLLYVPTKLGEEYANRLIKSISKEDLEEKIKNRIEPFKEILAKIPKNSPVYRNALKIILQTFFEALYMGYEEAANDALNTMEKFASGTPEFLIALELNAKLKDEEENWRKLTIEMLKYARRLCLRNITMHEAPYLFYKVARIEEYKLKDNLRAEEHYKDALNILLNLIFSAKPESFERYYDQTFLCNALFLTKKLSLYEIRKNELLPLVYSILDKRINRVRKSPLSVREGDFFKTLQLLNYLDEDERKRIIPLVSDLIEVLVNILEREKSLERDFYSCEMLHRNVGNFYRMLKLENKARYHFKRAFEKAREAVRVYSNNVDLSSCYVWLFKAVTNLIEAGEIGQEENPWAMPELKEVAENFINENHALIEELISDESGSIRKLQFIIEQLSRCEKVCHLINWNEHKTLCETVTTRLLEIAESMREKGDLYSSLMFYVMSAKISRVFSKDLESDCVKRIEDVINTLKIDLISYGLLVYRRDLNKYLYEFYTSINDEKRMLEYKKKLTISIAASKVVRYIDKFYDMMIRSSLMGERLWKDSHVGDESKS